ncbi:DUF4214 domain-containing protein [Vreelandella utahensis]|uniref:DUF4214 domain-containing protein n=1 Tax=Vreelandella halophila TaxID=86177 RepID=UPI00098699AE|nr:DUF4214 domain-containing protein [Halomonas utahensis]
MATATQEQVLELYIAILDRSPTQEEFDFWTSGITSGVASVETMRSSLVNDTEAGQNLYNDENSREDVVTALYQNLFGREPDAEGLDYWVNTSEANADQLALALLNGAGESDRAAIDERVDQAAAELGVEDGGGEQPGVPGETFALTENRDNLEGTENDDTFVGDVGQNDLGAISNALASGDVVDGGAGYDTIEATMINDNEVDFGGSQDPMPRTEDVEELSLNALEDVTLDADQVSGEQHYTSVDSRGDLIVNNVDIGSNQITKDITLEMKDTQQGSDLGVYFNEQDLKAAPDEVNQAAEFFIQVADGNAQDPEEPLANVEFDLQFTQDGSTETFENLTSTDGTYQGLVEAVQTALTDAGLTDYTVELGNEFNEFTTDNGQTFDLDYTGYSVNVTDDGGEPFENIEFTPTQKSGTELAIILAQSSIREEREVITNQVETTVVADGVGRGSDGGEIVVGSTSSSDSSTGIEVFNVTVENSSVVHDISTTNDGNSSWNGFQELNLTNGDVKGDFVLTNTEGTDVDTHGNVDSTGFKQGLDAINAENFEGDIVLGRDNDIVDAVALNAAVEGNVTYNATLTTGVTHTAVTGAGDDVYDVALNNDSSIAINAGNGSNFVNVTEGASPASSASITTGSGEDTVEGNAVSIEANTGSGNDVIYAENTGAKANFVIDTSTFGDDTATPAAEGSVDASINSGVEFLYNARVQVTLNTAGNAASASTDGLESELVTIQPEEGNLTTKADINNAIVQAINEDEQLSQIAEASVDANGDVAVQYLVDGAQAADAVQVDFFAPESQLGSTLQSNIESEFEQTYNDSGFFGGSGPADAQTAQNNALSGGLSGGFTSSAGVASTGTPAIYTVDLAGAGVDSSGDEVTFDTGAGAEVVYTSSGAENDSSLASSLVTQGTVSVDGVTYNVAAGASATEIELTAQSNVDETDDLVVATNDADGSGGAGFSQPTTTTFTPDQDGVAPTPASGSASVDTDNANIVNGGAGDDLIVLSSDTTVADTVAYSGYNQGDDTIVHFESGTDQLDLSAYLTNTLSDSESEDSQVDMAPVTGTGLALEANSVSIVDFNGGITDGNDLLDTEVDSAEFAELGTAELEAALEAESNGVSTSENADLYQDQAKSIVMVRNNEQDFNDGTVVQNQGEYKIFEVSYDNAAAYAAGDTDKDFSVKLVGTADFGDDASIAATDVEATAVA